MAVLLPPRWGLWRLARAPSLGEATLCGVAIDVDDQTGLARAIAPLRLGGRLSQTEPAFWLS